MTIDMQQTNFSHAKCLHCGHLGKIETFETMKDTRVTFTHVEGFGEPMAIVFVCPICKSQNTEALFPNEIN